MSRWLVTGAGGMLGRDLVAVLAENATDRIQVTAATRDDLDITDAEAVGTAVDGHDLVVNAAAYTDVDGAESDEDTATAVNGRGAGNVAAACARSGAVLLQLSTDYVLPGSVPPDSRPYPEDAVTGPVNAYGRSKLAGEVAVLRALPDRGYVVRTAWLYGEHGGNFVATMLRLAATRETLEVVDDQRGQPTWTRVLARQLLALGEAATAGSAPPGVYHGTAAGDTTWYGFARAVFAAAGLDPDRVRPTTSDAFPRPARRPAYSVLGHDRWNEAGVAVQPPWQRQLTDALTGSAFAAGRAALP
ncbi:MAG TPA: dTDP-4-dehydrorhamnose reductase [Cryptosporangiaceae bacterium]|nr:dTDP-4-dehydrorhamnose reductase [Cryptosporangiaceae bacterium]